MPDSWDFQNNKPERPTPPIMTWALAALCIVVTGANWIAADDRNSPWYVLGNLGYAPAQTIWAGHYAPLLTSVFLHGHPFSLFSLFHLVFNMMWLLQLGPVMEETMNPLAYAGFILTSAVIGSGAELAWAGRTGIGMSGVVYAMAGLMWAGRSSIPAWRPAMTQQTLNSLLIWGVFCMLGTWTGSMHIANAAHFGGLLYGFAIGFLFYAQRRKPAWALVLAGLVAMTVLSVTWMPWSQEWTYWKAEQAAAKHDYAVAISWYERSVRKNLTGMFALTRMSSCWAALATQAAQRGDKPAQDHAAREQQDAFNRMIAMGASLPLRRIEQADVPAGSPPGRPPNAGVSGTDE